MSSRAYQKLLVIITIVGCSIVTDIGCSKRSDLEKSLIGKWENIGLHITIHTYNNTDSTVIMDFNEDDLRTRFSLKPLVTVLNEDGTYYLEYRTKSDSLVARPSGEWLLKGDSIIMHQYVPNESSFSYHVTMMADKAEFRGLLDYDADGKADDEMIALSKKIETH